MIDSEFWADAAKVDPEQLFREFDLVKERSRIRIATDFFNCARYYDRAYQGFSSNNAVNDVRDLVEEFVRSKFSENVILRVISVITAKFARQRTSPRVMTTMGDWGMQRRADKYTRFLEGELHRSQVFDKQRKSDLFLSITGNGAIFCTSEDNKLLLQAVPSWQLFVDPVDGRDGNPDVIYWQQLVPRRKLLRKFPEHAGAIKLAQPGSSIDMFDAGASLDDDRIEVVSAWSLPSEADADDGMYICATRGQVLSGGEQGSWRRSRHPFAFARYMLVPDGMWGVGVVSQLVGLQDELNRTMEFRKTVLKRMASPFWLLQKGSKIVETHINNAIGHLLYYTGVKPEIAAPGVVQPEQFQHADRIKSSMFQNAGISELAAAAMKPAGIDSGVALRTYSDMMDDAFHDAMLRRDQQILDLSEIMLDEIESISEDEGNYSTTYSGPFGLEKIKYSEISTDRDAIKLKVVSTSALATTFAGRLQDVKDLQATNVEMSPQLTEDLLGLPDIAESKERQHSMRNLLMKLLEEEMLEHGRYVTPEPRWDIELALDLVAQTILMAQLNKCPKDRIDLLRMFEQECLVHWKAANTPPEPPPGPPGVPQLPGPQGPAEQQPMPAMPSPIAGGEMPAGPMPQ